MAWTNKVLRVNLSEGTCNSEPLNTEWAQDYIGQRGLATRYMVEEVDATCDPLGPDNELSARKQEHLQPGQGRG